MLPVYYGGFLVPISRTGFASIVVMFHGYEETTVTMLRADVRREHILDAPKGMPGMEFLRSFVCIRNLARHRPWHLGH